VIAMTARAMDEDRERCLAAGMNGYLSKPINQHALFNMLAEFGEPSEVVVPAEPDPSSIAPVISDPGLVRHVASLYLSTAPSQLARLVRALELGDAPQARAIAHSINGATAYFAGADTSACVAIEDLCANGHADRALTHIDQLRADIDALSTRLRAFLQ
jgi:CheY-like chemotaxis protein